MIYKKVRLIEDQISALAIGCWNFGGDWDSSNDDNTREIVHAAIANGINFFDVAPVYGWYHSEEVLGKILEEGGLRNKVMATSGAPSELASATPVMRLVAPGPSVARQTPARPVSRP